MGKLRPNKLYWRPQLSVVILHFSVRKAEMCGGCHLVWRWDGVFQWWRESDMMTRISGWIQSERGGRYHFCPLKTCSALKIIFSSLRHCSATFIKHLRWARYCGGYNINKPKLWSSRHSHLMEKKKFWHAHSHSSELIKFEEMICHLKIPTF